MSDIKLTPIKPPVATPMGAQAKSGMPFEPSLLVGLYSPDQWELFTQEWLQALKKKYHRVRRLSGPGDRGLDVVAFTSEANFNAPWDSYQCKRYSSALEPGDIWIEIGKIIYFSFIKASPFDGEYPVPRAHVFVAPKDVGLNAQKLLLNPEALKAGLRDKWANNCKNKLGKNIDAPLSGALEKYFDAFDFSIFGYEPVSEIIDEHKTSGYFITRFGAAFPEKPMPVSVPEEPSDEEAVYVRKLLDAYGENKGMTFYNAKDLNSDQGLQNHFKRQRELFYNAECLRGFARDTVPEGVYDTLTDDMYHGVIDTVESDYTCGLTRVRATITIAGSVDISGNALHSVTTVKEKQGICHQLANEDRLTWVK